LNFKKYLTKRSKDLFVTNRKDYSTYAMNIWLIYLKKGRLMKVL